MKLRNHTRRTDAHSAAAERAAWLFYVIAALGSTVGQIWVGVSVPPWPDGLPWWTKILFVLPFAVVIDLGGVVASAFADWRQRLGEAAYGWRTLSAASVTAGVAINILGHADVPYLAVVFGGLGVFAYTVWLLHSAARRRDALRAAGKLGDTAPAYGLTQWLREPAVTRRAKTLALTHGHSLYQSLNIARDQLRAETRRTALAAHVEQLIRSRHDNPVLASIAATTLDIDAVATALTTQADITGWARAIGTDLTPPRIPNDAPVAVDNEPDLAEDSSVTPGSVPPNHVLRTVPAKQAEYDRWRQLWAQLAAQPGISNQDLANRNGVHVRTIQRVRAIGPTGLLDSPIPPAVRLMHLATANGHDTPGHDSATQALP